MKAFVSAVIAQSFVATAAFAGSALQEADRCERFLRAVFEGNASKAVNIQEEEYPTESAGDKTSKSDKLQKTLALVEHAGGGFPIHNDHLPDISVKNGGDIVKRQSWLFPNAKTAFVGCSMYTLKDGEAYVTLKLEDNLDVLTSELTEAAASKTRSPAQRP